MRTSLPVDPHLKTLSEVATIALVQSHTTVHVPRIIANNSTSGNELKFEWILIEHIHGLPLIDIWASLTGDAKVSCVKEVAGIMAQLFELKYDSIGNLFDAKDLPIASEYKSQDNAVESNGSAHGRIVSTVLFWNTHLKSDIPRARFATSKYWLEAIFQLMEKDCKHVLESQDAEEDDIEDMEVAQQLLKPLRIQLLSFFTSIADDRKEFALHHNEISRHNFIFHPKGKIQALVDWECVSVMPLWKGCQIPSFIDTPERTEKPNPELYAPDYGR